MYCHWQYIPVMSQSPPRNLMEAMRHFDVETATRYVESIKWPECPCCPKCGSVNVGRIVSRARLQCREKGCRKQFSVTTGTIMESTHLKLDQWMVAVWMIANCRNGISSCEIARHVGCKQQTAWHLLHRVRHVLKDEAEGRFTGEVEADEKFVGGLFKFMSESRRHRAMRNGRPNGKSVVHAVKERSTGRVRAEVIPAARVEFVRDAVLEKVEPGAQLYTDSASAYAWAGSVYNHRAVNHAERYVDGPCHTNGLENFFNCLRRGLKGTYIKAHHEHLPAYVDEQVWRFNNRKESEWARFEKAMRGIVGKRLTYSTLTDGATR
jgi:transposase-like protein